ncbi:COG4648 family protein [Pseudoalteromonas sp. GB56]
MLKGIVNVLISIALLAYPVLVYFGLSNGYGQQVAWVLVALLASRLLLSLKKQAISSWLLPISACGLVVVFGAAISDEPKWLQLYPIVVNAIMAITFCVSLFQPQSMVERFARLQEPNLSEQGVRYTRKVTQIWCVFFVMNMLIASYTVYLDNVQVWTLYNGLIAYVLMGALAGGEFAYRFWLKRQGRLV